MNKILRYLALAVLSISFLASCGGNTGSGGGGGNTPSYTLALSSSSLSVVKGASAVVTLTIVPSNGFSGTVALSLEGAPSGVTVDPASVAVSGTTTQNLTISATAATPAGSYDVKVKGASGSISKTADLSLAISAAADFTVALAESDLSVAQTESGQLHLTVTPLNGFTGTVNLSLDPAPTGVTLNPVSVSISGPAPVEQALALAADAAAAVGSTALQLSAVSGSLSHQAGFNLQITAAPGTQDWVKQIGTPGHEKAYGVAVASDGSVYFTGYTQGAFTGNTNAGHTDAFLAKYDADGTLRWVKQIGGTNYDYGYAVTTLGNNVYVAGYTNSALDGHIGSYDTFLASYDADGNQNWLKQFGSAGNDYAHGLAARGSLIFVAGYTDGDMFGTINQGGADIYLAAFDTSGNAVPSQSLQTGTSSDDYAYALALAPDGSKVVVGATKGGISGSNQGLTDAFAIKIGSNGSQVWKKQFGSTANDRFWAVAIDSDGSIYAGGATEGNLAGHASFGGSDPMLFKLNADGTTAWSRHIGNATTDTGRGVAIDSSGDVYLTGRSSESMDPSDPDAAHIGNSDNYIVKFAADGTRGWTRQFGTATADESYAIAAGAALYVTGATQGDMDSGNAGGYDVYLARYAH